MPNKKIANNAMLVECVLRQDTENSIKNAIRNKRETYELKCDTIL